MYSSLRGGHAKAIPSDRPCWTTEVISLLSHHPSHLAWIPQNLSMVPPSPPLRLPPSPLPSPSQLPRNTLKDKQYNPSKRRLARVRRLREDESYDHAVKAQRLGEDKNEDHSDEETLLLTYGAHTRVSHDSDGHSC